LQRKIICGNPLEMKWLKIINNLNHSYFSAWVKFQEPHPSQKAKIREQMTVPPQKQYFIIFLVFLLFAEKL
jgi:hypothetical protein